VRRISERASGGGSIRHYSGIIKEPTPLEQIQVLLPKLSAAEREELIRELLVSQ